VVFVRVCVSAVGNADLLRVNPLAFPPVIRKIHGDKIASIFRMFVQFELHSISLSKINYGHILTYIVKGLCMDIRRLTLFVASPFLSRLRTDITGVTHEVQCVNAHCRGSEGHGEAD
jgi:hypothetical protein